MECRRSASDQSQSQQSRQERRINDPTGFLRYESSSAALPDPERHRIRVSSQQLGDGKTAYPDESRSEPERRAQDGHWSKHELDFLDLMRKVAKASSKIAQEMAPDRWVNVLFTEEDANTFREKFRRLSFLNEISHSFCMKARDMRAREKKWDHHNEIVRIDKQLSNVIHRYDQAVEELSCARNEKLQELLPQELRSQESFPKKYPEELEKCIKDNLEAILSNKEVPEERRCHFIKAVGELGDKEVAPRLVEILGDQGIDRKMRESIGEAIVRLGDQEVALQMLNDNRIDQELRESIGEATGRLGDKEVVPRLVDILGDERIDSKLHWYIVHAIDKLGDKEVVPRLVEMLGNQGIYSVVRFGITKAIGKLGDKEVVPRLVEMLGDKGITGDVRCGISEVICKLGDKKVVPRLTEMLDEEGIHPDVSDSIADAIAKLSNREE